MVEKFMQFLISIIDAQLFKRIQVEVFESKNVQNTNEIGTFFSRIGTFVDMIN